jgi:hypothetical protein
MEQSNRKAPQDAQHTAPEEVLSPGSWQKRSALSEQRRVEAQDLATKSAAQAREAAATGTQAAKKAFESAKHTAESAKHTAQKSGLGVADRIAQGWEKAKHLFGDEDVGPLDDLGAEPIKADHLPGAAPRDDKARQALAEHEATKSSLLKDKIEAAKTTLKDKPQELVHEAQQSLKSHDQALSAMEQFEEVKEGTKSRMQDTANKAKKQVEQILGQDVTLPSLPAVAAVRSHETAEPAVQSVSGPDKQSHQGGVMEGLQDKLGDMRITNEQRAEEARRAADEERSRRLHIEEVISSQNELAHVEKQHELQDKAIKARQAREQATVEKEAAARGASQKLSEAADAAKQGLGAGATAVTSKAKSAANLASEVVHGMRADLSEDAHQARHTAEQASAAAHAKGDEMVQRGRGLTERLKSTVASVAQKFRHPHLGHDHPQQHEDVVPMPSDPIKTDPSDPRTNTELGEDGPRRDLARKGHQ